MNAVANQEPYHPIHLVFSSVQSATTFLNRCYAERKRERGRARKSFNLGDPEYGKTPWDELAFSRKNSDVWVFIPEQPTLGE